MHDAEAVRTDAGRPAPQAIAEKCRIDGGFRSLAAGTRENERARGAGIGVGKSACLVRETIAPAVSRLSSRTVLPDRKTITFHLRRIRIEFSSPP
jgi:hypothetical protein